MTREQMLARQNEILQAARAESRAMTAEERAEFDTLQRSIEALDRAGATAGGEGSSRGAAAGEGEGNGDEGGEGNGDGARSAVENERARIRQIEEEKDKFHYSRVGVLCCLLHIPVKRNYYYFCSQFVADLLQQCKTVSMHKDTALYLPNHLPGELAQQSCLKEIVYNVI